MGHEGSRTALLRKKLPLHHVVQAAAEVPQSTTNNHGMEAASFRWPC